MPEVFDRRRRLYMALLWRPEVFSRLFIFSFSASQFLLEAPNVD
jgi:hypothetical protein